MGFRMGEKALGGVSPHPGLGGLVSEVDGTGRAEGGRAERGRCQQGLAGGGRAGVCC